MTGFRGRRSIRSSMNNQLAPKLKAYRESVGCTQEDLARLCGIRVELIRYYEAGGRMPSLNHLLIFCKVLGVPPKDLGWGDAPSSTG